MRVTIGNLKGGVGKTTTAVHLAAGLARTGPTLLVDADPQSQSAYDWSLTAQDRGEPLPVEVYPCVDDLGRRVRGMADRYAHIVIDTGGENDRLFRAACAVAPELVVPVSPSLIDVRRIPATFAAAREAQDATGVEVFARVLLVRVDARTADGPAARAFLEGEGLPVMGAQVRDAVAYARAFGYAPGGQLGDYEAVLAELLAEVPA